MLMLCMILPVMIMDRHGSTIAGPARMFWLRGFLLIVLLLCVVLLRVALHAPALRFPASRPHALHAST